MLPAASVSDWYFSHPDTKYFGVGKIDRDQLVDYAERQAISHEVAEIHLAPNLGFQTKNRHKNVLHKLELNLIKIGSKVTDLFEKLLSEKQTLLADGATGTNLFEMGLQSGDAPELWNVDEPDKIAAH